MRIDNRQPAEDDVKSVKRRPKKRPYTVRWSWSGELPAGARWWFSTYQEKRFATLRSAENHTDGYEPLKPCSEGAWLYEIWFDDNKVA